MSKSLQTIRVKSNPRAVGFLLISITLLIFSITHLLLHQQSMQQAMNQLWAF
jgi:hypothetical protein